MATIKSYTDISQSKKLAEILPLESADMVLPFRHPKNDEYIPGYIVSRNYVEVYNEMMKLPAMEKEDVCKLIQPSWSLTALLNLLPSEFTEKGKYSETTYEIDIRKYALTKDVDIYQIAYGNYKFHEDGNSSWKDMINTSQKENLLDVAFEMICWLKENNKL